VRFRVWNTSSFVILTAAYSIQPYFVMMSVTCPVPMPLTMTLNRCIFAKFGPIACSAMAAMRQHRRRWRRLLLLASAAAAAVHGSARAKGAGGDLVAPGALRPYDGAPAEKRKRGTVRHPAAGFFVAGSSIEDMNGVYARVHTVGGCIDTLYAATARRHAAGCGACWCCPVHWFSGRGAAASRHMLCQSLNHCPLILLATALARRHHRTFSMTSTTSTASGQCMRGMT
jgi:hypothetical protein